MTSYSLKEGEVKMVRPKYNTETGEFLGIYETVGYIILRVSPEEVFFNFSFDKEKSIICIIDIARWFKVAS